ncbi:aspartate aminotransferase family protein [Allorhizobium terrae]|uniref:Aspartate aminotransferase family protein n=1 Tax=Allorhizobium terrae TaxID=1848972 RepID=A0A4S4A667_9HYPH|nr:aspartate aminotransferase family protein [Allorhizobium terrae]THF54070.1 aspartate aminotransferase family protein [Allorhizobium terrae]
MTILNSTRELQKTDAAHHLHPFTNTRELNARGTRVITTGKGVYLYDSEGNKILDGMSGLWCVNVGHGRKDIVDAVARQMEELAYYNTFFNTTHPPVVALSKLLSDLTPKQFNYFHFTGSGSESNDTIFRLARYYWQLMDKPEKTIFISRRGGYHGSTVASASLGGFGSMHAQGGLPIPGIFHAPPPSWWANGGDLTPDEFGLKVANQTLELIDSIGAHKIAAMIGEPIMGAGGVIVPPKTYWPAVAKGLKERDILFISDEVICGFGRTGQWFGCELMGTEPDFMTMAKGITSGYVPMGCVGVSDRIAHVLLEKGDEFAHGYTYSGHPAACAAALVNLEIIRSEKLIERVRDDIGPYLQAKWKALADHPMVGEAVMEGLIGAFQFTSDKKARASFAEEAKIGLTARDFSFENGLVMRAVGDRMVIAPPLTITHAEVDELMEKTIKVIDLTYAHARKNGLIG